MRIILLTLVFAIGYILGEIDNPDIHQRAETSFEPCFNTTNEAQFHHSLGEWDALYFEMTGKRLSDQIPTGHYKGTYIPTSCFVLEGSGGSVKFYQRPFNNGGMDMTLPSFISNPWMDHHRASQKG